MDAKYYLLICTSDDFTTPELQLYPFDQYSALWQYLQDLLFLNDIKWYQIYWGETMIMQRTVN